MLYIAKVGRTVETEDTSWKWILFGQYFCQFVVYLTVTIFWGLYMTNAKKIDDTFTSWCHTATDDVNGVEGND